MVGEELPHVSHYFVDVHPYFRRRLLIVGGRNSAVEAALRRANCNLPDYARVTRWLPADSAFTTANGLLTGTGRIRRTALLERYGQAIELLYCEAQTS